MSLAHKSILSDFTEVVSNQPPPPLCVGGGGLPQKWDVRFFDWDILWQSCMAGSKHLSEPFFLGKTRHHDGNTLECIQKSEEIALNESLGVVTQSQIWNVPWVSTCRFRLLPRTSRTIAMWTRFGVSFTLLLKIFLIFKKSIWPEKSFCHSHCTHSFLEKSRLSNQCWILNFPFLI